eukprot:scaffold10482_cov53-Phaeocystis_antarctica.AAC.2
MPARPHSTSLWLAHPKLPPLHCGVFLLKDGKCLSTTRSTDPLMRTWAETRFVDLAYDARARNLPSYKAVAQSCTAANCLAN